MRSISFLMLIGGIINNGVFSLAESDRPELIVSGLQFTEGPVWHPGGYLLFSDIPANIIYKWTPGGKLEKFRDPSGNSNGLAMDKQGRLIACEHGNRRVSRTELDGSITVIAHRYKEKKLNSPNDVVVKSDGSVYFTDPPYGVQPDQRELDFQGVYRVGSDGTLTLLVDDFDKPNGLAFSPDEKILYVADTARKHIRAFDIQPDGTLAKGRIFAENVFEAGHGPDGMKVDINGNLYATAGFVWVFDRKGKYIDKIVTPNPPANLAFGGADKKVLFITARSSVYQIRLKVQGL